MQSWHTPFPIWNQSVVSCSVLTCFLTCIQIFPSLKEFSTVYCGPHSQRLWHVNKAEIDVFLELSCFFDDPTDIGNLIYGSSAFSKTSLNIWNFMVHVLLKLGVEKFEHYFTSVWDECNCVVVWAFFGIAFGIEMKSNDNKRLTFPLLISFC